MGLFSEISEIVAVEFVDFVNASGIHPLLPEDKIPKSAAFLILCEAVLGASYELWAGVRKADDSELVALAKVNPVSPSAKTETSENYNFRHTFNPPSVGGNPPSWPAGEKFYVVVQIVKLINGQPPLVLHARTVKGKFYT